MNPEEENLVKEENKKEVKTKQSLSIIYGSWMSTEIS